MRVVGVSRVLNEADLIEPFIRHHAALLDLHIVLDGGSTDGTVEILQALHAEGMKLQVYQTSSPIFLEHVLNTGLYRLALAQEADWVVFLDADEMLVVRGGERLHAILALVPAEVACLQLQVFRYAVPEVPSGLHPFGALTLRDAAPHMVKVLARRLEAARITLAAGNHFAVVDGSQDSGLTQDRIMLAHVPDRSPLQAARKAILGRLKVVASGAGAAAEFNTHTEPVFQALKTDPRTWLQQAEAAQRSASVEDRVAYLGGDLRYTRAPDELARLLALFAAQGELLARSHGAILDRKRFIRRQKEDDGRVIHRLF